ncbi:MAG: DUF3823 domain-containing protein [Prevotella sp.]|nr:DUF3823 domain-containing protein [Prevotella sp.]MCH4211254.1 DUF3823 domain-containing protein [Prevotella sp.]MCH4241607.1 DUF3823 domain-containing protein [Prevotella sp.]
MKRLIYCIVCVLCVSSCTLDNYDGPSETFRGTITDSISGRGFETEVGDDGVQFKMLETSYCANPTPWFLTCCQNGTFQDTKVFNGNYNITPYGAFVPFVETGNNGKITKDKSVNLKISGTVSHNFIVEPFLEVTWVGEPTVSNNQIKVQVKIERGTSNPNYQQKCTDVFLFINSSSPYVSSNNYDSRISVSLSGSAAKTAPGSVVTLTSNKVTSGMTYYVRVGARIDYATNGVKRYNYNEPKSIVVP